MVLKGVTYIVFILRSLLHWCFCVLKLLWIALKASSCVTLSVIFATRANIICIDSGTCDTICVSIALAMRFFDISINRYTPRHHPVWAGSRSWVSRHLSLHLSIRGNELGVRSCLIFRYRIWPKKQCILEQHSNLLQKYNLCWLLLTITHKYLSSHETRKHRHIFARFAAFWQRVFQTLPNLDVHPGVTV